MNTYWLAFLTGLTTGGISCLAVQGGLLASSLTQQKSENKKILVGSFLVAKILAYTLLGFGLGLMGSRLTISSTLQGWMQILVGIFMLLTAARLLDVHPLFRYFVIQPPKILYRLVRKVSKDSSFVAPLLLGGLTVLIPCGVTQAIMILAIASGDPIVGAGIMFAFTLGTAPIFFGLGIAALAALKHKGLAYLAALIISILGILSINTGQVLRGSFHTLQNYYKTATIDVTTQQGKVAGINREGTQDVTIKVSDTSYSSDTTTLKVGVPVKLSLVTNNNNSCTRGFVIPQLNITKVLPQTGSEVVEFTPIKTGTLAYNCSMGMFTGQFTVVN